ncbi:MmcQ/YjbR family DNA-binding protein [Flavobacterium oreochromis]|uniref:MmcQ-like protein n=1 Tax=Flavobacterium columnare TaxID=996 RepID=A0A246GDC5_9FLAO|nr:MmcQ/YjbR family DNA-binding protein [Flavobacterium oreochromis]OWP79295.1 MmcQ-like protein [Flavobacterium oreochromis]
MNIQQLYDYCLSKKGVTEHFPFDDDILVFKVGGKIFCLTSLQEWENGTPSLNLKCDPEKAQELRSEYEAIIPGYHMNKKHWNTIKYNIDVPNKMILELINHSYNLILKSLPKKTQLEIFNY